MPQCILDRLFLLRRAMRDNTLPFTDIVVLTLCFRSNPRHPHLSQYGCEALDLCCSNLQQSRYASGICLFSKAIEDSLHDIRLRIIKIIYLPDDFINIISDINRLNIGFAVFNDQDTGPCNIMLL